MWVGRRKIMAVIDTTAQVTLINRRLSQELGCQDLVERVQLQNAQMDSWMDGGIVQHFGFQWGRQKYFWDVVEADIGDDFIIGVDFLKSVKCKIDLEGNVLKLGNGDCVQAMMKKNGDGQEIHVSRCCCSRKLQFCQRAWNLSRHLWRTQLICHFYWNRENQHLCLRFRCWLTAKVPWRFVSSTSGKI